MDFFPYPPIPPSPHLFCLLPSAFFQFSISTGDVRTEIFYNWQEQCIIKHRLIDMAKQRSKSDLPQKICPVCQRPFAWRKKWADCWDDVKYCSERCRRRRVQAST